MSTDTRPDRPLPAPLPFSTEAGRGEIPAPRPAPPATPEVPDGPLLREDEFCLYVTLGIVLAFVLLMAVVAKTGGL
ncbi:hypothetical protein [Dietzia maris]|uniref:hypothetical protein n=1 Tax=Dietzia maris TaxID=37915 RepID=UPI0037C8F151